MLEYYSTGEVAEIFGVTTKTIRNWDADDTFVPERRNGEDRMYSRQQIEQKLGKKIEEALNPIWALDQEGINALIWLCKDKIESVDFHEALGDTMKERYQHLYVRLVQRSTGIHRKSGIGETNWILTSPEIAAWFETLTAGFAPVWTEQTDNKITYIGTLNRRWKIYCSTLVEPDTLLMGLVSKNQIIKKEECLAVFKLKEWLF